jgi:HSP20 family protein
VHRFERVYGVFERTFALPNTVDPDKIEARFENGVLLVRIPKAERARPREIRVSTSASGTSQVRSGAQSQRVTGQSSQRSGGRNGGEKDAEEEGSAAKNR